VSHSFCIIQWWWWWLLLLILLLILLLLLHKKFWINYQRCQKSKLKSDQFQNTYSFSSKSKYRFIFHRPLFLEYLFYKPADHSWNSPLGNKIDLSSFYYYFPADPPAANLSFFSSNCRHSKVGRFNHLTLRWFYLSICDTTIGKKYFSTGPQCLIFLLRHWSPDFWPNSMS